MEFQCSSCRRPFDGPSRGPKTRRCADCRATEVEARRQKWRADNADKQTASRRRWREKNPERDRAITATWSARNRDRVLGSWRRKNIRIRVPLEKYEALVSVQGGLCAICRRACSTGRRLAIDHDHATGRVRGLLCAWCNVKLPLLEQFATAASAYLASPPAEGLDSGAILNS